MGTNFCSMTTTEKIDAIKAISAAVPVLGTFAKRGAAVAKLGEIIASLNPQCKCKVRSAPATFLQPITCNSTTDAVSLPFNSPTS